MKESKIGTSARPAPTPNVPARVPASRPIIEKNKNQSKNKQIVWYKEVFLQNPNDLPEKATLAYLFHSCRSMSCSKMVCNECFFIISCLYVSHLEVTFLITAKATKATMTIKKQTTQYQVLHVVIPTKLLRPLPPRRNTNNWTHEKITIKKSSFFVGTCFPSSLRKL